MNRVGESALKRPSSYHPAPAAESAPPVLRELLEEAGIAFDGRNAWDIQVRNPRVFDRVLRQGSLGFGEAYMDGDWEAERLDELFHRLLAADIDQKIQGLTRMRVLLAIARNLIFNLQSPARAYQVGEQHYDIGNDIYTAMLDPTMSYSCGYWAEADNLDDAQTAKLDLICRKLELEPGQRLLDIGCGWGGLARHAAAHYGVEVTGLTVSKEQQRLAQERCDGLPVRIELMDYRDLEGTFDRVASVGMFEHVGPKNYDTFFATVDRVMDPAGLFLLHTIGDYHTTNNIDPWIDKYIFPNGKLPSAQRLAAALEPRWIVEDWHNFGQDYDRTLMAWWRNFDAAWPDLAPRYGERFYRMWKYYLHACAGMFRARQGQLWQIVLSKRGRPAVYRSVR